MFVWWKRQRNTPCKILKSCRLVRVGLYLSILVDWSDLLYHIHPSFLFLDLTLGVIPKIWKVGFFKTSTLLPPDNLSWVLRLAILANQTSMGEKGVWQYLFSKQNNQEFSIGTAGTCKKMFGSSNLNLPKNEWDEKNSRSIDWICFKGWREIWYVKLCQTKSKVNDSFHTRIYQQKTDPQLESIWRNWWNILCSDLHQSK